MNIFINWPRPTGLMLSKASSIEQGCYACQWLDNVDIYTYAKFDQKKTMWFKSYERFH